MSRRWRFKLRVSFRLSLSVEVYPISPQGDSITIRFSHTFVLLVLACNNSPMPKSAASHKHQFVGTHCECLDLLGTSSHKNRERWDDLWYFVSRNLVLIRIIVIILCVKRQDSSPDVRDAKFLLGLCDAVLEFHFFSRRTAPHDEPPPTPQHRSNANGRKCCLFRFIVQVCLTGGGVPPSSADQTFACIGQNSVDLVAMNAGEPGKKFLHAGAFIQILKQGANRHTRSFKHPCAADAIWRTLYRRALIPIEHGKNYRILTPAANVYLQVNGSCRTAAAGIQESICETLFGPAPIHVAIEVADSQDITLLRIRMACHFFSRYFSLDNPRLHANLVGVRRRQPWRDGGGAKTGVAPHCGLRRADLTQRREAAKPQGRHGQLARCCQATCRAAVSGGSPVLPIALDCSCGSQMGRKAAAEASTAAESRVRPPIIQYSINLVCFMIPSLQASFIPPVLTILTEMNTSDCP